MKIIIGIGHYSRVGKDSLANEIHSHLVARGVRVYKRPFAQKLKEVAYDLYGWDGLMDEEFYNTKEGEAYRDVPLPTIGKTPVEIWVELGNSLRDHIYKETWVEQVLETLDEGVTIIPDVRFPNEAEAIREKGGYLIKVIRPGVVPKDTVSDRALLDYENWDIVFCNEGSYSQLRLFAEEIAAKLEAKRDLAEIQSESAIIKHLVREYEWHSPGR